MSSTALPMTTTEVTEGSDAYLGTGAPRIAKEKLKELSEVNSFWPTVHIATEYALMFGSAWLCSLYFNPVLYVVTVIWIGSRLHALGVLLHDCAHYRLYKNRKLNDFVGEVMLAWPLLITMYGYRRNHFNHHRFLNTDQDPDYVRKNRWQEYRMPKTAKELCKIMLKYMVGGYVVRESKAALFDAKLSLDLPMWLKRGRIAYYLTIAIAASVFGFWDMVALYWIIPLLTGFLLLLNIRGVADHFGDFHEGNHESIYTQSRTTIFKNPLEAFFFSPYNINYHIEHHFYPGVPYYNLPKLHAILKEDAAYQKQAHLTDGFIKGLFKECQGRGYIKPSASQQPQSQA